MESTTLKSFYRQKKKSVSDAETVSILFIVALRNVAMVYSIGG